jgi:hypothetical protein
LLSFLVEAHPKCAADYDEGYDNPKKQYQHLNSVGNNFFKHFKPSQ